VSVASLSDAPPAGRISSASSRLRIADVTMFYGERSGGIRTYLKAKAAFAARSGAYEHHLIVPGTATRQRSLRLAASNGYRLPLGAAGLVAALHRIRPHVVLLHDPFWTPRQATRVAHALGAGVVAVHHASALLQAAGLPGPDIVYAQALRQWYRRAYLDVDAVMSVVDPLTDTRRPATLPLRLGIEPAFHPQPDLRRGDEVLYAGRLSREKGLGTLLDAAAAAAEPWPLALVGTGPIGHALADRVRRLGLGSRVTFEPFEADRRRLAARFARARCVVLPGAHETFGLAALEAAACGAPVVTASTTPAAALLGPAVRTFRAGDSAHLLRAIESARRRIPDLDAAAGLAEHHGWDRVFTAELADLRRVLTLEVRS
jgi:alpha-1,6-mannosyltransferase